MINLHVFVTIFHLKVSSHSRSLIFLLGDKYSLPPPVFPSFFRSSKQRSTSYSSGMTSTSFKSITYYVAMVIDDDIILLSSLHISSVHIYVCVYFILPELFISILAHTAYTIHIFIKSFHQECTVQSVSVHTFIHVASIAPILRLDSDVLSTTDLCRH